MIPDDYQRGFRRLTTIVLGTIVFLVFDVNRNLILRFCPDNPDLWDTKTFPWIADLEAAYPAIRLEVERYLRARDGMDAAMADVATMNGYEVDGDGAESSVPGVRGHWRAIPLYLFGKWKPQSVDFPETKLATRNIPWMNNYGFSGLDPGSHILKHVGPNKGALRFQLPIIVPGDFGDCRIWVNGETVNWEEGKAVVFDLAVPHEVWNDTDSTRILLMMELRTPLPFPLSLVNRFAQWTFRYFPSFRGLQTRVDQMQIQPTT